MNSFRVFPLVSALCIVCAGFIACGGKVALEEGDAGVDASPTTKPTTTATPTPTTTTTVAPPSCPTYRPIRGTPCSIGLSCFYPCAPGYRTSIRATCPGGTWTTADVETCGAPPPPPPDCETCQRDKCAAEQAACTATDAARKGCNDLINCLTACTDADCQNRCITDSTSAEGKDLIMCIVDNCSGVCSG
jgi:hypothetical protein